MRFSAVIAALIVLVLSVSESAQAQTQPPVTGDNGNGRIFSGGDDTDPGSNRIAGNTDVVRSNSRPEFALIGPVGQVNRAIQRLGGAGARALRIRDLPALNRRIAILDLRNELSLGDARRLLAQVAPRTRIDLHSYYRFAGSQPRLFAPQMLGVAPGCRLPSRLRVGLIDGPVDIGHPALAGATVTTVSVLGKREKSTDARHGTAVAALIAGQDSSGALSGYASGAQLFAVTAFAREPRGPGTDVERIGAALDWLVARKVRLINMSFAGPVNEAMDELLAAAAQRGAVMIAAAGNSGSSDAAYPAAAAPVIAVTAVDAAGRRYRAANTGRHIEFAAPGVDLYVAGRRGGTYASGTSYAAPIVTALAARWMAKGVTSANALRARLRATAVDLGNPGRDTNFGWGLVRAPGC